MYVDKLLVIKHDSPLTETAYRFRSVFSDLGTPQPEPQSRRCFFILRPKYSAAVCNWQYTTGDTK
jgi:hypothetical protein